MHWPSFPIAVLLALTSTAAPSHVDRRPVSIPLDLTNLAPATTEPIEISSGSPTPLGLHW